MEEGGGEGGRRDGGTTFLSRKWLYIKLVLRTQGRLQKSSRAAVRNGLPADKRGKDFTRSDWAFLLLLCGRLDQNKGPAVQAAAKRGSVPRQYHLG